MFNFNSFLINCLFIILIYFFGFFRRDFVVCDDLIKLVYNNITVRYTPTLSSTRLYDSIEFFQNYILNTHRSNFKFSVYRYLQPNGLRFPRDCVYDHYHINLYLNNVQNVHYNFPLNHNPWKLGLSLDEYKKFNDFDLKNRKLTQYILNNLYIYDLNLLKIQDYTDVYNNYIDRNKNGCVFQFQNVFKNK